MINNGVLILEGGSVSNLQMRANRKHYTVLIINSVGGYVLFYVRFYVHLICAFDYVLLICAFFMCILCAPPVTPGTQPR